MHPRLAALALLLAAGPALAADAPAKKLNVLFIAVDDLNCSLGCYGHPVVKTPNIDRLAAKGVRFDRAYCQYPLCNPSRTSFLSGRLPDVTRVLDNGTSPRAHLGKDYVFLPEHFKKHGYFTGRVGKIAHGRVESAVKWDLSEGPGGRAKLKPEPAPDAPAGGGLKITWRATDRKDEAEPDGRTARRVAQLVEKHKGKPFFLAAGFHKPHLPFVAPKKYFDLYPPAKIVLPKEPANVRKGVPSAAFTRTAGDDKMTDKEKREAIAAYYACVSFMDAQVGVLLDAVDKHKLWDSTVVVFFSDHGFHLSEHGGLWRKMTLFEESARVPLIVAAPGKKAKAVSPRLAELLDLYPTLTDLCGLPTPKALDGRSLKPLLEDPKAKWDRAVAYTVVGRGGKKDKLLGRAVRTDRYRYAEWGGPKEAELYDHEKDPREFVNLADDPKHADTLARMRKLLRERWKTAKE